MNDFRCDLHNSTLWSRYMEMPKDDLATAYNEDLANLLDKHAPLIRRKQGRKSLGCIEMTLLRRGVPYALQKESIERVKILFSRIFKTTESTMLKQLQTQPKRIIMKA